MSERPAMVTPEQREEWRAHYGEHACAEIEYLTESAEDSGSEEK